ncbi:HpcH/HpaI aldolase/citrate lyase family protein [Aquabacterium sp. J223]|uniref:HpcH/HpaI aldolase/citrate lyase family protein n=1 Tax=Aquabacterium sp. J223 TaxID=2898431 RepID=UPI0021AE0492|nr:aldolase/citrate lyase family protein [Aquabacterium sp. J223]
MLHPRDALFDDGPAWPALPVCDHYAGVEPRMRKSLALQAELGPVFDVTLDLEDGAPVGGELEHADLIAELATSPGNRFGRVGARLLPWGHPRFEAVADRLLQRAGGRLAYLMLPKVDRLDDLQAAAAALDGLCDRHGLARRIPLHALVESALAVQQAPALAAHPRIESLSFGLMDFVSSHRGAIGQAAMTAQGQFEHPLVLRAKLEIAAACHAARKVPSHGVVTEFRDRKALEVAAHRAAAQLGFLRMWSIHPDQVRTIVEAFAPSAAEVDQAVEILQAAQAVGFAPIRHHHHGREQLHDRASYRYFWQVLERAERTSLAGGAQLPAEVRRAWFVQAA